jgi:serine/threonine protein kinase/TolA-binding protein
MSEAGRGRLKVLFEAAIALPADERSAWIAEACGDDAAMRQELESLVQAHERPHRVFATAAAPASLLSADFHLPAGYRIGAYEIVRHIGDGGMGAVYEATRSDGTFAKSVAIKVVHGGLQSAEIVRRFHAERQVLASLTHANIATLLDAGATESGQPYFVMEYVDGAPIDTYCHQHALPLDQRLRLFLDICAAVEHAHSHLVIHRDLKPDNVLVRQDGEVKLLDFGIAKVLRADPDADAQQTTLFRPMTLRYASPEQVRGETVTTATDVYSLGVLLYQLLTGASPYARDLAGAQMERAITDAAPARPSDAARDNASIAWRRDLPGDLDAIVLMALRKEPERRYRSVDQLAEDIRRYRARLPIAARPDTTGYRVRKFVSRNRMASVASAVAVLILIAGIVTTTWIARVARREAAVAIAEREKARLEATRVQRLNEFLTNVLALPDANWYSPGAGSRYDMTVADLLKQAARRIDVELGNYPDLAADLHHTLGNTYRSRGMFEDAKQQFSEALALRRKAFGPRHAKVAESLYFLGASEYWLGRERLSTDLFRQALDIERGLPPGDARNLPYLLTDLCGQLRGLGELAEAETYCREALALVEQRNGANDPRTIFPIFALAEVLFARDDMAGARRNFERALTIARAAPELHHVPQALAKLAGMEGAEHHFERAEMLLREAVEKETAASGPTSTQMGTWLALLSGVLRERGQLDEALATARRAVAIQRERLGRTNPRTASALMELGHILAALGRTAEAERTFREALALTHDSDNGNLCTAGLAKWNMAIFLYGVRRVQEGRAFADPAIDEVARGCGRDGRMHREIVAAEAARLAKSRAGS